MSGANEKRSVVAHSGHSSQLVIDATDRNPQLLQQLRSGLVRQVEIDLTVQKQV